jgi:hypothetical protein
MTGKNTQLLAAVQFLWELARFLGLFALALLRFQGVLAEDPAAVLWLVALGSGQLLAPALLALFLYSPAKRPTLLPFVRLAKILQVFPVLLLAFATASRRGAPLPPLTWIPPRLALSAALLAVSVVDLVFLLLLFTLRAADSGLPAEDGGLRQGRSPEEP